MNFTTDELDTIFWIVKKYKTILESDAEKQEIETIKKKLIFMIRANIFAENAMDIIPVEDIRNYVQYQKKKEEVKEEVKPKKKIISNHSIPDSWEKSEKVKIEKKTKIIYNEWVRDCRTKKLWIYYYIYEDDEETSYRRQIRYDDKKELLWCFGEKKKSYIVIQSDDNVDSQ